MTWSSLRRRRVLVPVVAITLLAALGLTVYLVWWNRPALPAPGSPRYEEYAEAFEAGTAAGETSLLTAMALEKLSRAIELIPQEPAAWANRALVHLRSSKGDDSLRQAAADAARASQL